MNGKERRSLGDLALSVCVFCELLLCENSLSLGASQVGVAPIIHRFEGESF